MKVLYSIEDLIQLMDNNGVDFLSRVNLIELDTAENVLINTTLTPYECESEEELDTTESAITSYFNAGSKNLIHPFRITDPAKVVRGDRMKHVKSGTLVTVTYVGLYQGNIIHIIQRDSPWTQRVDITQGDTMEIIKQ